MFRRTAYSIKNHPIFSAGIVLAIFLIGLLVVLHKPGNTTATAGLDPAVLSQQSVVGAQYSTQISSVGAQQSDANLNVVASDGTQQASTGSSAAVQSVAQTELPTDKATTSQSPATTTNNDQTKTVTNILDQTTTAIQGTIPALQNAVKL